MSHDATDGAGEGMEDRLAMVVRSFHVSALTQAEEMDRLAAELDEGGWRDTDPLNTLERLAHKLAGSAGSLGFVPLGRDAGALELILRALLSGEGDRGAELVDQARLLTRVIVTAIQGLRPEDSTLSLAGLDGLDWGAGVDPSLIVAIGLESGVIAELEAMGLAILAVDNAHDWDALVTGAPGAVIADLAMIGADPELADRVKALGEGTAILAVGGAGTFIWRVRASRMNARHYLPHCDAQELMDHLARILSDRGAGPPRILVLEDDQTLATLYTTILAEAGMEAEALTDPSHILDTLSAFEPDVLISDLHMPGYSGAEVAAAVRHGDQWATLPIIFLSREQDLEHQIAALASGADFFLPKPILPSFLVSVAKDRAARGRSLRDMTLRDPLTRLYNHTASLDLLDRELARARRGRTSLSVALIDIDHFKGINDQYGHHTGDRVIKGLARLMRGRLRGTDLLGRCGGEEFLAILPGTPGDRAVTVIDALRQGFHDTPLSTPEGERALSFSAGLATFDGAEVGRDDRPVPTARDLFNRADGALYEAKNQGRNRVVADRG